MKKIMLLILIYYSGISLAQACNFGQNSLQSLMNPPDNSQETVWLGADVATSIAASPNRIIWLFGDTLLGMVHNKSRQLQAMVHNSVGVMVCRDNSWHPIKKYVRDYAHKPAAIFSLTNHQQYLWPVAGIFLQHQLWLTAYRINAKDGGLLGTVLIEVKNPTAVPSLWHYSSYLLPMTSATLNYASAIVKTGRWIYLLGVQGKGLKAKSVMARISKKAFVQHRWQAIKQLSVATQLPLLSETSLLPDYQQGGWVIYAIPPLSRDVHRYHSKNLQKAWQDKGVIYQFPARTIVKQTVNYYALKAHPELGAKLFTYNTNFMSWQKTSWQQLEDSIKDSINSGFYVPQELLLS
jgi:hypothetical protein